MAFTLAFFIFLGLVKFANGTDKVALYKILAQKYVECMDDMDGRAPGELSTVLSITVSICSIVLSIGPIYILLALYISSTDMWFASRILPTVQRPWTSR